MPKLVVFEQAFRTERERETSVDCVAVCNSSVCHLLPGVVPWCHRLGLLPVTWKSEHRADTIDLRDAAKTESRG